MTDSPLEDAYDLIRNMPPLDLADEWNADGSINHQKFGRMERIADWIAASQNKEIPEIEKTTLAIFAGSHGLARHNVSVSDQDATKKRIKKLQDGKLETNGVAADARANVKVFELALELPTKNIAEDAALTPKECAATIAFGMEAAVDNPDCLALGVMGIGGGTAAAAVATGLYGGTPEYWVRAGAGTPSEINTSRTELVEAALAIHKGHLDNPLEVLQRLGGRELAACVGAIIAARYQKIPVVLDSFATCVAAGVVHSINPDGLAHVMASQLTDRPAHEAIMERIHLDPILNLQLKLGDGFGSALAISTLRASAIVRRMGIEADNA